MRGKGKLREELAPPCGTAALPPLRSDRAPDGSRPCRSRSAWRIGARAPDGQSADAEVEFTDGIDLDLAYSTNFLGGTARFQLTGQYILNLNLQAGSGAPVSRLDGCARASDLRLNGSLVWGRGGISLGSVVNYVDGFTNNRPNVTPVQVGSYTTASVFLGFDLGRLATSPALVDSEVQLVAAMCSTSVRQRSATAIWVLTPTTIRPIPARSASC